MGARCRAVEELDQVSRLAEFCQHLEKRLKYPRAAEPPEPLPYAVPFSIFVGECAPRYAVHSKVVDGFQEFTVIMSRLSPARLRSIKHFQHDRPIALRHSRQHVRLPDAGHAVIRTKPDSGIRQKCMPGIPSTRPSNARSSSDRSRPSRASTGSQSGHMHAAGRGSGDFCRDTEASADHGLAAAQRRRKPSLAARRRVVCSTMTAKRSHSVIARRFSVPARDAVIGRHARQ